MVESTSISIKLDAMKANKELAGLTQTVVSFGKAEDTTTKKTKAFDKALGDLGNEQARLKKNVDKTTRSMTAHAKSIKAVDYFKMVIGANLAYQAFTTVRLAITQTVDELVTLDKTLAEVSTLFGDNQSIKQLTSDVLDLSRAFGTSSVEEAKGLYQVISAGFTSSAESVRVLTQANKLALGGVTDIKTAADGLTSVLNAYNLTSSESARVSDVLFASMRLGKTTVGELSDAIGDLAPIASASGTSIEQMFAAVTTLTTGGIKTSTAVQNVRNVLNKIIKGPTLAAKKEIERLKKSGDLALDFEFSSGGLAAAGGLKGFIDQIKEATNAVVELDGAGNAEVVGGAADSIAKLFGNVRAITPVLALSGKQAEIYSKVLKGIGDSSGATELAVAKMTNTFSFQSNKLAKTIQADFQEGILPSLQGLTKFLNEASSQDGGGFVRYASEAFGLFANVIVFAGDTVVNFATTILPNAFAVAAEAIAEFVDWFVNKQLTILDGIDKLTNGFLKFETIRQSLKGTSDGLREFIDKTEEFQKLNTSKFIDRTAKSFDTLVLAESNYNKEKEKEIELEKQSIAQKKALQAAIDAANSGINKAAKPTGLEKFFKNKEYSSFIEKFTNDIGTFGDVANDAFSSAGDAFADFLTTGKADFKDFVTSVLTDVARLMANQALAGLLSMGLSSIGSSFFSGSAPVQGPTLSGATLDTQSFTSFDDYEKALFDGVEGFASGGMHSGGLRIVGENGPELEATGPSRIFNNKDTMAMLSGDNSSNVNTVSNTFNIQSGVTAKELRAVIPEIRNATMMAMSDNMRRRGQASGPFVNARSS